MKILVTGKRGQVARSISDLADQFADLSILFGARKGADVVFDLAEPATISAAIEQAKPDVIINAAAFTAVDLAEDEKDAAFLVNADGPRHLAKAAKAQGAKLVHISTDYVFDGTLERPYREDDAVYPLGVYGKSKLAGELAVRQEMDDFTIIRTGWVYSPYGKNFKKTMLKLAETRAEISVVSDQWGTPTCAKDLASCILMLAELWRSGSSAGLGDVFHFGGRHEMTWFDFASSIMAESAASGGPSAKVRPISSVDYPVRALRPQNSRLDSSKIRKLLNLMPFEHQSLLKSAS